MELPPTGGYKVLGRNVNAFDVAEYMCLLVNSLFYDNFTRNLAHEVALEGGDPINELAALAWTSATFERDTTDQILRTPQRLIADKKANCVDYTIFIASIAKVLGLPVVIRIARFSGYEVFTHVYPIIDGVVMDMVLGQENGVQTFPQIGHEAESIETKDFVLT